MTRDACFRSQFLRLRFLEFTRSLVLLRKNVTSLRKFIIVGYNLNAKLVAAEYLAKLTVNDENNYKVFESFTRECSSTLLCIMHSLGHCGGDETLVEIISRHLEVRLYFDHEEDDAGGYIANFMRRIRNGRERGKKNQLNLYIK